MSNLREIAPAIRAVQVPEPLRELPGWLMWRFEQFTGEVKARKIPFWADGTRRHGQQGSPQDRARLTTFEAAREAAARAGFSGVGFAPLAEFGYVFLDFDNCIGAGGTPLEIERIVGRTYAEYSPSGKGIRAVLKGDLGNHKSASTPDQYGFETFSSSGFVTLTGNILPGCDVMGYADHIAVVDPFTLDLCQRRFGSSSAAGKFDPDDFMAGREPRLGLTHERMSELLAKLDPSMGREPWLRVGMALHHECEGDDTGLDLWDEWSSGGDTYPGTEGIRAQWNSFRPAPGKRSVTMASVIRMAKDATKLSSPERVPAQVEQLKASIQATPYAWRDPARIPQRPWLYGRWLLLGTVACVVAPGGVGKSTLIAGMALSIATGREYLGKTVWGGAQKVWVWNLEDDLDELSRSIQAAAKLHGIRPDEIEGNLFVDSALDGAGLCTAVEDRNGMKLLAPVYKALQEELIRRDIKVLIVDPFVSSHAVEENSNTKIDQIAKAWARVAKAAGCVIILVNHTSKAGSSEVNANSSRGASALTSAARPVLTLNRMTPDDARKFGIDEEQRRRFIVVNDDKHNRAPSESGSWFELVSVELGNGSLEQRGDSVGALQTWTPLNFAEEIATADVAKIQRLVEAGTYRDNSQASDWVGRAIAEVLGLDLENGGEKARVKVLQRNLLKSGHLRTEQRKDISGKYRPYVISGVRRRVELKNGADLV